MDANNTNALVGGLTGTLISAFGATISITQLQAIFSLIATVLGLLITLISGVIIPLIKHFRQAKQDGKITNDELDIIKQDLDNGLNILNKFNEEQMKKEKENER